MNTEAATPRRSGHRYTMLQEPWLTRKQLAKAIQELHDLQEYRRIATTTLNRQTKPK